MFTNELWDFAQSDKFTDLMMRPDMVTRAKAPTGWEHFGAESFNRQDEQQLLEFGSSMTGNPEWFAEMKKTRESQDFVFELDDGVRLRCKIALCGNGRFYTVNLRKIPNSILELENTGLPASVTRLLNQGRGLIIVTGPTGAGKTTTLAAMVDYLNRNQSQHIVTLERPIEYIHTNMKSIITQRDVPNDVVTFADGLRDALRQSINTIMIGEVMDRATVDTMLMAAESGHLVLATMHTASAEDTIMRLASFYGGDEVKQKLAVVSSVLNGVIGQVLLPSLNGKEWKLGYELMLNNNVIANAIYNSDLKALNSHVQRESQNPENGMCLLNDCLAKQVREKQVPSEAAVRASYDPNGLMKMLSRPAQKVA